jgi:hypothetical protein
MDKQYGGKIALGMGRKWSWKWLVKLVIYGCGNGCGNG